jgi:hypothetical protein
MGRDWLWKLIERASTIILVVCALFGTYYAAATFYGWDKQTATDAKVHPATEGAMTLPPIWIAAAFFSIAIAMLFTMWAMIYIRQRSKNTATKKQNIATENDSIESPSYLKEAHVYAGIPGNPETPPRVAVSFGRSGRDVEICVDFSHFMSGLGAGGWTKRRRLLLKQIKSYRRDEEIHIPIMWRDVMNDAVGWRWGDAAVRYENRILGFLNPKAHYRCRIAFIFADGAEEYAYFIIATNNSDEMPNVIGYHMFDFVKEWETES